MSKSRHRLSRTNIDWELNLSKLGVVTRTTCGSPEGISCVGSRLVSRMYIGPLSDRPLTCRFSQSQLVRVKEENLLRKETD